MEASETRVSGFGVSLPSWLRIPDRLRGGSVFGLVSLLTLAFLFQLRFASSPPIEWDLSAYAYWGDLARNHFLNLYSFGGQNINIWQIPEYPPLVIYLFGAVEFVYFGLAHLFGVSQGSSLSGSYLIVLKLPLIFIHLAAVGIIWGIVRRLAHPAIAWLLLATYAFSPVVLLDIEAWGQTDDLTLLLALGALIFALKQKGIAAGVVMGLMVVFKPQPLIFVPLVIIYLLRWSGTRQVARALAALVVTALLIWLPYLLPFSSPPEVFAWLQNTHRIVAVAGCQFAGCNGYNLWTVVPGQLGLTTPLLGPLSPQLIGLGLFALVLIAVLYKAWSTPSEGVLWAGAAMIALAFYTLNVDQFERYIFPALGLFLLAAFYNRWQWPVYVVVSCVAFLNLLLIAQRTSGNARITIFLIPHLSSPRVAVALGALNLIVLVWAIYFFLADRGTVAGAAAGTGGVTGSRATATTRFFVPTTNSATASQRETRTHGFLRPRRLMREPYISVVIPCYNEAGNIAAMHERLTAVIQPLTSTYELIFVDNGSYDGSATIFAELAAADPLVTVLTLSRNFGSQGAYTSGMEYSSGDCLICIDGDIQDPPELIPSFVEKWKEGYDVVYGVRARRKGSLLRRAGYKAFYRLLQRVSYIDIPLDAGDFGLIDRRVVDVMNAMPERNRLIRGLRAWAGFQQTGVPYTRAERFSGRTTNSIMALFRWANLGLVSFSFAPLSLISYLAAVVVGLAAVGLVVYSALYFIVPDAPRGFQTLLIVVLFLGAVQLLCLSIIGSYLARMFEEIKARPKFLVEAVQNDHRADTLKLPISTVATRTNSRPETEPADLYGNVR